MENASKALIIAGGILLALLILSTLIYVGTTMSNMADQQNQSKQLEQTAEFNRTYEAYNRSRLYGTDVISVVNRAIDYNKQLDADEEEYFINIVIETTTSFTATKQEVTRYGNGQETSNNSEVIQGNSLMSAGTYQVRERDGSVRINEKVEDFFLFYSKDNVSINDDDPSKIKYTYTYSGLTNFKSAIFMCEYVNYNESGRIKEMKFKQI